MSKALHKALGLLFLTGASLPNLHSATYTVSTTGDNIATTTTLRYALNQVQLSGNASDTINITATGTINLGADLPIVGNLANTTSGKAVTITGPGSGSLTVNGGGTFQAFFVSPVDQGSGGAITLALSGVTISAGGVVGGAGGAGMSGGGGGLGAGGGLFVDNGATVSLSDVIFSGCSVTGGGGGSGATVATALGNGGGAGYGNGSGGGAAQTAVGTNDGFAGGGGGGFRAVGGNSINGGGGGGGANFTPGYSVGTGGSTASGNTGGGGAGGTGTLINGTGSGGTGSAGGVTSGGNGGQGYAAAGGTGGVGTGAAGGVGGSFGSGSGGGGGGGDGIAAGAGANGNVSGGGGGGGGSVPPSDNANGGSGGRAGGLFAGGGGGGGGDGSSGQTGGNGGQAISFGGGGGGGKICEAAGGSLVVSSLGGAGGWGGGGGAGNSAGAGGWGGGGGGTYSGGTAASGGTLGGTGGIGNTSGGAGGGGAGLGGAIFVAPGGTLNITGAVTSGTSSRIAGSAGAQTGGGTSPTAGTAGGADIFFAGTLLNISSGQTLTLNSTNSLGLIAGSTFAPTGQGTLNITAPVDFSSTSFVQLVTGIHLSLNSSSASIFPAGVNVQLDGGSSLNISGSTFTQSIGGLVSTGGTSGLVQLGAHTLVLAPTSSQSYSGSIQSNTNSGTVSFQGGSGVTQTLNGSNGATTWNTTIAGLGTLEFTASNSLGNGALTFSSAGVLATSGTITLNPSSIVLNANGTINVEGSGDVLTYAGSISGSNNLIKTGPGTLQLQLSGATYGGQTLVQVGTMSLVSGTALPSATVLNVSNGATFVTAVNQQVAGLTGSGSVGIANGILLTINTPSTNYTFSGTLGGGTSGAVTITGGSGVMNLTGSNNYSGATTVTSGGILGVGPNTAFTGSLVVGAGGILQAYGNYSSGFNVSASTGHITTIDSGTYTFSGNITGGGNTLSFDGPGNLILAPASGSNSFGTLAITSGTVTASSTGLPATGITLSAAAILATGSGGTFPPNIAVNGNSTIEVDSNTTLTGVLSGASRLTKTGSATLTIATNAPSYSGQLNISTGSVLVSPGVTIDTAGSVTVTSTGTLLGSGAGTATMGALTNSGAVTLDTTFPTVSVTSASFQPSSTLNIAVSPTQHGTLNIASAGALTLSTSGAGVNLIVNAAGSFVGGQNYTYSIITGSGTATGTFANASNVTVNGARLTGSITGYSLEEDEFGLGAINVQLLLTSSGSLFPSMAFTSPNALAVANNLDVIDLATAFSTDPDLGNAVDVFATQTLAQNQAGLEQLHPAQMSAFVELQPIVGDLILSAMHARSYRTCVGYKPVDIWVQPYGVWAAEQTRQFQASFKTNSRGLAYGIDYQPTKHWAIGLGGVYDNSNLHWGGHRGQGNRKANYGAFYTDYNSKWAHLGASVLGGLDTYNATRHIQFTGTNAKATSYSKGFEILAQLEGRLIFDKERSPMQVMPYFSVDYFYIYQGRYTENGAGSLNLAVESNRSSTIRGEIGFDISGKLEYSKGCFQPFVGLGYSVEAPLSRPKYVAHFINQTLPFEVKGWHHVWNLFTPHVGFELSHKNFNFTADYQLETGQQFFSQRGMGRLSWGF